MSWKATLVHGNDDVVERDVETVKAAVEWAQAEEAKRHQPGRRTVLDAKFRVEQDGFVQYGHDYHYLSIERSQVTSPPGP